MSSDAVIAANARRSADAPPAAPECSADAGGEGRAAQPGPAATELPAIAVRGISKSYRIYSKPIDRLKQAFSWGRKQYYHDFWALRDINFEVQRGEAIGIIGRNGSGKSTLLQIIAGTLAPTDGEVLVGGRVAALLELGSGFNPEFTGRENVFMNGAILGLSQREITERFDAIAAFADIGEFIEQPVKTYSSGMMMRLAFSVATCVDPDILIVDEALSVGDLLFQHRCMERIRSLCANGTTLLFVSHDPDALRALCSRAVWLEHGAQRMLGPAKQVADEYMRSFNIQRNAQVIQTEKAGGAQTADFFTPLDAAAQNLDGQDVVAVAAVRILNSHGEPTEGIGPAERFCVEIRLRAKRDVAHLSVGFVIKSKHGVELTGESVFNAFRRAFSIRQDEERVIRFTSVNVLRGGHYSVAVRVHHVTRWDRSDAVALFSDEVAAAFHVLHDPEQPMWFHFRQPFDVDIA